MENIEVKPICFQIKITNHCIKKYIDSFVEKKMNWDVTSVEGRALVRILGELKRNPNKELTASDVMRILKINKSATSKLINNLERKGYIEFSECKNDARRKPIQITKKSLQIADNFDDFFKNMDKNIESCLTEKEKHDLNEILLKIQNKLQTMEGDNK